MHRAEFEYYVNLNERGTFYADVRDARGVTVWETHGEAIEDGFMRDASDVAGLADYLASIGIIPEGAYIASAN